MKNNIHSIKFTASKSSGEVSGVVVMPEAPELFLVLAHGAGADMNHSFMKTISDYLADEGIGVLRYNFPYTENKKKRPDFAPVLIETVRSAINAAKKYSKDIPLLAGGKSMGGRMTSMAASKEVLEGVKGIVFFGFPLHPPGQQSIERSEHLFDVKIPILFLQGSKDKLTEPDLLKPIVKELGDRATLHIIDGADHSFKVLKSSGMTKDEVLRLLAGQVKDWGTHIISQ